MWLLRPHGEDNRRGEKSKQGSHTPDDPKGSADLVRVLVVRSGFNGFVDYLFIVLALTSTRNGGMRFESGSRPFEN